MSQCLATYRGTKSPIFHGIEDGISYINAMPERQYHAMHFFNDMVFFDAKLLIYKGKMAKKQRVKIMVFLRHLQGFPC